MAQEHTRVVDYNVDMAVDIDGLLRGSVEDVEGCVDVQLHDLRALLQPLLRLLRADSLIC